MTLFTYANFLLLGYQYKMDDKVVVLLQNLTQIRRKRLQMLHYLLLIATRLNNVQISVILNELNVHQIQ